MDVSGGYLHHVGKMLQREVLMKFLQGSQLSMLDFLNMLVVRDIRALIWYVLKTILRTVPPSPMLMPIPAS